MEVWLQRDGVDIVLREGVFVAVEGVAGFGEADKAAPGVGCGQDRVQIGQGGVGTFAHSALGGGQVADAVEAVGTVAGRAVEVAFEREAGGVPVGAIEEGGLTLPAEAGEVVGTLHVPFAEVAGVVAGRRQLVGPVEVGRAQPGLVRVNRMFGEEHAVVVGQEAGHEAGVRGRADGAGGVGAAEAHACGRESIEVGRAAGVGGLEHAALHLVGHEEEDVGRGHASSSIRAHLRGKISRSGKARPDKMMFAVLMGDQATLMMG